MPALFLLALLLPTSPAQFPQDAQDSLATPAQPIALQRLLDSSAQLATPIDVVSRAGDSRRFIVELPGTVRIWEGDHVAPTPFLDMSAMVYATGLTGLRGIAFHPQYDQNGFVYVWFDTIDAQQQIDIVLGRFQRSSQDANLVDSSSYFELLRAPQEARGHGSSRPVFGPDGYLYAALGDGGVQQDPSCNAQDHQSLMGTIIRIDVDSGSPYGIPPDNPFVGNANVRDECWLLGMRHPWRWSFDALTQDLYIADVGQIAYEEVNVVPAGIGGLNFGWSVMEGPQCFAATQCGTTAPACHDAAYTAPAFYYDHTQGCSITGGFVYRGSAIPHLYGHYFFSDFCSGRLWSFRWDGQSAQDFQDWTPTLVSLNGGQLTQPIAFAEDQDGELLVIDYPDQEIYRLVPPCFVEAYCPGTPHSGGVPADLRWAGSTSVSAADFTLLIQNAPPNTFATPFYASDLASLPVGGGLLCVGSSNGLNRLSILPVNVQGRAHLALDFQSAPVGAGPAQITAGSVWNFQVWYRDPGGVGSANSNLTGALQVFFCN